MKKARNTPDPRNLRLSLEQQLSASFAKRAEDQIKNYQRSKNRALLEHRRRKSRDTTYTESFSFEEPELWSRGKLHNPYFVRSRQRQLAHSKAVEIRNQHYRPSEPERFSIPRRNGTSREVVAFNIVDESISHYLLRSITRKNLQRLSAHSYAYLPDRGPFDALAWIKSEWSGKDRLYIAEFDFRDYFSSIKHSTLLEAIKDAELLLTPTEEFLIQEFLGAMEPRDGCGILQGTSLSVLLANVAALKLDRGFERTGVGYARYADDTVLWSPDYSRITEATDLLFSNARAIGAAINHSKSPGIRLLVSEPDQPAEIASTTQVEFLGHAIGTHGACLSSRSIRKIKERLATLLYGNLLREPLRQTLKPSRLGSLDRDYVSCIWQLRSYIYGDLSENQLRRLSSGSIPKEKTFHGIASFYPLADDSSQWEELDHWMSHQIRNCLAKRLTLLPPHARNLQPYKSLDSRNLNELSNLKHVASNGQVIDLRIPSFRKANAVVTSAVRQNGFGVLGKGAGKYLYRL